MSGLFSARFTALLVVIFLGDAHLSAAQPTLLPSSLEGEVICWQQGVKLRWQDFAAPHYFLQASLLDVRVGACSAAEVAVLPFQDAQGKSTFLVESFFVKKHSWVRDSAVMRNAVVLAHEQVHFDINELFARKVRQQVAQWSAAGRYMYGPELARESTRLLNAKTTFNARFDLEAHHDPSEEEVQKWQLLVNQELAALEAYKSSAATCGH
jgi:hypothetical protein